MDTQPTRRPAASLVEEGGAAISGASDDGPAGSIAPAPMEKSYVIPPAIQEAAARVARAKESLATALRHLAGVDNEWHMRQAFTLNHMKLIDRREAHVILAIKEWTNEGASVPSRYPEGGGYWVFEVRDERNHPLGGPFNTREEARSWAAAQWPTAVIQEEGV